MTVTFAARARTVCAVGGFFVFSAATSLGQAQGTASCPAVLPDAEIEVRADESDFLQQQQMVVLTGAVDVVQGPIQLSANKVLITYTSDQDDDSAPSNDAEQNTENQEAMAGTITRLDAIGAVNVRCGSERAKGQTASYNILARAIDLAGAVTLVRDGNVLKGEKLHIDLNTGRSRMVGNADREKKTGERVRAIFRTPKSKSTPAETEER